MSEQEQSEDLYEKYIKILYPGYENMSDRRKADIEMRTMGLRGRLPIIDKIFTEMKDPKSPLYRTGVTDKDIVNIADLYVEIVMDSRRPMGYPTGEVKRGGDYYDTPEDVLKWEDPSESQVMYFIENAVDKFNSKPRISISSIINGTKKQKLVKEEALYVNEKYFVKDAQEDKTQEDKEM